jgi:hypothetical protein
MSIPTYTLGYPPDGSFLGQTKAIIRDNLDGTFKTLGIDHVNNNGQPGSNPAGYHTVIHQVTQAAAPANIPGINQVFSMIPPSGIPDAINPQLFDITNSIVSQLTGNSATVNGYVWCAGILFQWGTVPTPGPSGMVTFPVKFPNAIFNVQTSIRYDGTHSVNSLFIDGAPTQTDFSYTETISSITAFFWFAIGN